MIFSLLIYFYQYRLRQCFSRSVIEERGGWVNKGEEIMVEAVSNCKHIWDIFLWDGVIWGCNEL